MSGGDGRDSDGPGFSELFGDDPRTRRIDSKPKATPGPKPRRRRRPRADERGASEPELEDDERGASEPELEDDDPLLFRGEVPAREFRALRMGRTRPETRIDLHGLDRAKAHHHLRKAFGTAAAMGLRCVIVIHGHGGRSPTGESTLKRSLPGWLRSEPLAGHVRGFTPAPPRDGGAGATLVLLRPRELRPREPQSLERSRKRGRR